MYNPKILKIKLWSWESSEREFIRMGNLSLKNYPQLSAVIFYRKPKCHQNQKDVFIGIEPLEDFGYAEIRQYGKNALLL